jgi:gluconolactonase
MEIAFQPLLLLLLSATLLQAQDANDILDAERVSAVTELVFTEGPAYDADGAVYFTDINNNRILRRSANPQRTEVFLQPSYRANGLMFDHQGGLIVCEGNERGDGTDGGRRITRIDTKTKSRTVIADRYQGERFNSPNDLCIDRRGRIYFSDPYYGGHRDQLDMDVEGVYRVDADGGNLVRLLDKSQVVRPNGLGLSPDEKRLYVVDHYSQPPASRSVFGFDIQDDGSLANREILYDFGSGRGGDGMAVDVEGNLYVTAGANRFYRNQDLSIPAGVYVLDPGGKLLATIKVPEDMITNCCFGGPDLKTLYITSGKTLWSIRTKIAGRVTWPQTGGQK